MTTYECFRTAERIEHLTAEIYATLAVAGWADDETRARFRRLSDEELQHAARIRLLGASQRHSRTLFAGVKELEGELRAALREAERLLAEVRAGGWGSDPAAVNGRLAAMEERLSDVHAEQLARAEDPAVARFFEALARQDREHRVLLSGANAERAGDAGGEGPNRTRHRRDGWEG